MRALWCMLALAAGAAFAQDGGRVVAKVFGKPVTAADLKWSGEGDKALVDAAIQLRQRAGRGIAARFIAANRLEATEEDFAAYARFDAEIRSADTKRRAERLKSVERELKARGLDAAKRQRLEEERGVLNNAGEIDARRASEPEPTLAEKKRVWGPWITGFKSNKALYQKYGGRVGVTKFGYDPVGAIEALLREHEKSGDLEILDAALAGEFWAQYAREPRQLAKPEEIDFTYHWLKPLPQGLR